MGHNTMSGHREKTTNVFEEWRQLHDGTWQEFRIRHYTDGSSTQQTLSNPISEKEYFKRKLSNDV